VLVATTLSTPGPLPVDRLLGIAWASTFRISAQ
jgi:hypothetical protein